MIYCYYQGKPIVIPLHACYRYCNIEVVTPSAKALAILFDIAIRNDRYRAWDVQTPSLTLTLTLLIPSAVYADSTL